MNVVHFIKRAVPLLFTCAVFVAAPLAQAEAQERPAPAPREPIEKPKLPAPVPSGPKLPTPPPSDPKLPRIQVSPPTITSPQADARVGSPVTVSGTGQERMAARVSVTIKGEWEESGKKVSRGLSEASAMVNAQGQWSTAPMALNVPANAKDVKFEISAVQSIAGSASTPTTITVFPAMIAAKMPVQANVVMHPFLTVTSPKNDQKLSGKPKSLTVEGTGSGKTVDIYLEINIHRETGNFLTGKQRTVQQLHRNYRDIPIKDRKWSTNLDLSFNNDKNVTKVVYKIQALMTDQSQRLRQSIVVRR